MPRITPPKCTPQILLPAPTARRDPRSCDSGSGAMVFPTSRQHSDAYIELGAGYISSVQQQQGEWTRRHLALHITILPLSRALQSCL